MVVVLHTNEILRNLVLQLWTNNADVDAAKRIILSTGKGENCGENARALRE